MIRTSFIVLFVCFALAGLATTEARAEVSVSAEVEPAIVTVGAEARLIVTIKGKFRRGAEPELPALDDFSVYQAGTSQSFSFVNGRQSATIQYTYVLVPSKAGAYTIDPIRFKTGDKVYSTRPLKLEVVKSATNLPRQPRPGTVDAADDGSSPIFIRSTVDVDTVYVNQQVTWTMGFHTDGSVELLRSPEYKAPSSEGFWVEDLSPQKSAYRNIAGKRYLVHEIQRAYFPTTPGYFKIGPARVDIVINDRQTTLDDFFRPNRRVFGFGDTKTLSSEEIDIVVLPLPTARRPANFSGLVGRDLTISVSADRQVVEAGEPINVSLEIAGRGNFKAMASPKLPELRDFKIYESSAKSDLAKDGTVITGRKKSDFVVVPKREGEQVIPEIEMSYFDPVAETYNQIRSDPIRITVNPGVEDEGGRQVIFAGSGDDIEVLAQDINHIHTIPGSLFTATRPLYTRSWFLALHGLPLLAVVLALVVDQRRRRWANDSPAVRASRALARAEKRLQEARRSARGHEAGAFPMVADALRGFVADKMGVSASGLTGERIDAFLLENDASEEVRHEFATTLEKCDSVAYAPVTSPEQISKFVDEAVSTVRRANKDLTS